MTDRVVAFVPDLMDRTRLDGRVVDVVTDLDRLVTAAAGASLVVVDLGRPGAVQVAASLVVTGIRVVGFAPHVDSELRAASSDAGVEVVPRSKFFGSLDTWIEPRRT
jgi:hypothetical protein